MLPVKKNLVARHKTNKTCNSFSLFCIQCLPLGGQTSKLEFSLVNMFFDVQRVLLLFLKVEFFYYS